MGKPLWLSKDVFGGILSQPRPDRSPPDHWRLEDVFATARPHHPALSPDGTRIAFVLDIEGTTDLWAITVDDRTLSRLTSDRSIVAFWEDSAPVWSPDGTDIAYNSEGCVHVVPASGGPPRRLLPGSVGAWLDDQHLAVVVERDSCSRLAVVDIDDPWPAPLGPDNGDVGRAQVAPDGRILLSFYPKDDFSRNDIVIIDLDGSWTTLVSHPDRRAGNHVVNGNRVAYTLEEGDWSGVFLTDLDGGEHFRLATGERDFSSLTWDNNGETLLAIATSRGKSDLVRIGLDGTVDLVAEGGTWDSPMSTSLGVVAIHEAYDSPASITYVGADGTRSVLYDGAPASVRSAPHAKLERIIFNSSDGLEIEGFLFRPADTSNPVPAVVHPHGGPTSYSGDEWDGHAQYFVDKGYAWLAINFRGSTTYGLTFEPRQPWGLGWGRCRGLPGGGGISVCPGVGRPESHRHLRDQLRLLPDLRLAGAPREPVRLWGIQIWRRHRPPDLLGPRRSGRAGGPRADDGSPFPRSEGLSRRFTHSSNRAYQPTASLCSWRERHEGQRQAGRRAGRGAGPDRGHLRVLHLPDRRTWPAPSRAAAPFLPPARAFPRLVLDVGVV